MTVRPEEAGTGAPDESRPAVLLIVDRQSRAQLLGRGLDAVSPRAVAIGAAASTLFAPNSRDAVEGAIRDALHERHIPLEAEVELATGGTRLSLRAEPLRDFDGTIVGACLLAAAPGEGAEADDQRLGEIARLQRREAIGQLAMGIAHDFNNLLSVVAGASANLAGVAALLADADAREDVAAIRAACTRASALVRQLLAFGGAAERAPGTIGLDAAITDVAALLERLWQGRAKLVLDLGAGASAVEADATEFDQVILNLALNARDAMLDGGTLTIRTRWLDAEPRGGLAASGPRVAIELADTGIGIAPDVLPRIFDPFFTTKRSRGGTGLGLATVGNLVRRAGGTITVESTVGTGTCFRLVFPDAASHGSATSRPADAVATLGAPAVADHEAAPSAAAEGAILLVDDDDLVRRLAQRALTQRGWTVLSAASGEAALDLMRGTSGPIRGLVTDLSLPGMDGEDVIQAVRSHLRAPELPVVIASGFRASPAASHALRDDPAFASTRFLTKPYLPSDLLETLDAVMAAASASHGANPAR